MFSVEGAPGGQGFFPLSAAQMNIYFAQKLAPHVPFTIAQYVEIRGHLDPSILIRATDIACRELQSPGVRIVEIDGRPYQRYDGNVPYAMIYRDLRGDTDPVGTAHAYMDEQYRKPVDLVRDQLIASEIIQVGEAHYFWYSRAHHVVMDGLGAISVQERTAAAYTALLTGSDLPKTKAATVREIYDYEAAYPGSSRYESDREYWLGRLDGHADAPRLAGGQSDAPSDVSVSVGADLDAGITSAMAELARRYNSSDVPVVLAAFALYLARMTDTEDVMLSLPVSGRATTRLRSSSGMMSNIVPLRIDAGTDATVEELLRRIQVELTGALRHQRFRVEDMQRAAGGGVSSAAGRGAFGPTVNIMMYDSTIRLGEVIGEYRVLSSGPIDDMMVNVYPGVAGASTRVDFLGNPALYSTADLATHHARFLDLLSTLVAAEDGTHLGDIDVLAPTERASFEPSSARPATLPELVHPGAVIRYDGIDYPVSMTMAADLADRGVGPEVRVALALGRSHLSVLAALAVSAAGGSFVPVDPREPAPRLVEMLDGVAFGIAERSAIPTLPAAIEWVAVEDLEVGPQFETTPAHLDNEAYVIHTSGSTGKPKAVSITHRGLAGLAAAVVEKYPITSSSRVLQLASPVFDASIQEILAAVSTGATLVVAPADVYAGPALAELLAAERITHLITSPTVLATLEPRDLAGVEVFDVGGEACPPDLRDRFAGGAPTSRMLNAYGPTETTVLATLSDPMTSGEPVTIGSALPGVRAVVLDARLRVVPAGGIGELYLGGDGLARGYSGQPGLTAAAFVADPDPDADGRRLYRTGDVVRTLIGGELEYLGRRDQQVQLRGRRVELGEIEIAAGTGFAVAMRDDRLIGYTTGSAASLDAQLRHRLPAWMVPERIIELAELPMTPGGKLDRRALPFPPNVTDTGYVAPVGDTEARVAAVFADVLGVTDVGRLHSFFELGGDSLSATRVVARLGSGVTLPVLFDAPTVAELASHIDSAAVQPASLDLLETVVPDRVPLSYAQQRMWFLNQFDSASTAYTMPVALQLTEGTDPELVVTALRDVLERHESLRTYFPDDGAGPRQVVVPTDAVLPNISRSTVSEVELDAVIARLAATGFDVATGVPMRAALLTVEPSGDTVVAIALHHISVDGWSIDPLVRDFSVAYEARSAGHAPTWPRLQAQYSQYAVWNRAFVDAVAGAQTTYWTGLLDSDIPPAALPADRPRPPVQSMRTADVPVSIDAELHQRITRMARQANETTFMIVHAALAVTLSRFGTSGGSKVARTVVGSPSAGRGHAALDEMVGMFVGTVPLAVDVDLGARFTDLVAAVRRADLDAFARSDLPFERIVDALATDRSLDRHPLFQVMLAFDNAQHERVDGLPVDVMPVSTNSSEFDLTVVLTETADGITGCVEYALDLYDRDTVERFADAFLTILRAAVDDPSVVVGDIALAPPLLFSEAGEAGTLLNVLGSAARGELAIDGETAMTYQELEARSNRLARLLISHGAGPEVTVALSLERSADYIVSLWAVAKAGAAFVPVDPNYPALRRQQMLAGTSLGIGTGDQGGTLWLQESEAQSHSDAPVTDADRIGVLLPEHPAYVIHTSGSTGAPKPVTVTHASVYLLAKQVIPRYTVEPSSRVLHGYSVNFDAAVLELVLAFGAGATMVIAPTSLTDGNDIAQFLTEHAVTHYLSTPAVLATVPPVACVTTVAVGGDVLGGAVVEQWSPGRRMLNAYGPSEATVLATLTDPLVPGGPVTIGRSLDHVDTLVLDARLRRVPVGGIGELYLGGAGLARGYRARAGLTAERFVAAEGGRRMYRTGDLVRLGESGELEFVGRSDAQVQIRGVRVELGDVRAALLAHPDVRDAVVDARDGRLLAWVVGEDRELREWLLDRLPLSMVPATLTVIDRIPVTANGKVDTAALPDPAELPGAGAARTLAEDVVVGLFSDILGADVTAESNFFVLGGDSLTATRAAARVGAALGRHVPVRTVFEAPTPRRLVAAIETLTEPDILPPLIHRPQARQYTQVSPAERRIWLQNRFDPESAAYNIAFTLPLPEDADRAVLRAAITDVIDRHLPLRTVYRSSADGPVATLVDAEIVVSSLDERHTNTSATEGFDLTLEPPLRLSIAGGKRLLVVAHHIAVDGLSVGPLARDIETAVTARRAGLAPQFAPLAIDYADYRMWQHEVLAAVGARQLDYWRTALAGMPDYLDLPQGTPTPDEPTVPVQFEIDAATLTELRALAHRLGATVFVVVHAALAAVLAEASGTADIAIGTPVSGRTDPALDELVGMFVGTVVLRTPVDPSLTFEQFVALVLGRDLDAFAHSAVPFEWVVDAAAPTRTVDAHPLFQVLLAVGGTESPSFDLGAGAATPKRIETGENQFDLEVVVDDSIDGLTGRISYAADRFERSVCVGLAERLTEVLQLAAQQPTAALGSREFLGTGSSGVTREGVAEQYTLRTLLERATQQWPDATAVVDGTTELTYRDLDRRSNMLLEKIIREGAEPGTVVAVVLPRSADLVTALWAVAKSGAAYLPIDPTLPAERIEEMITRAAPVITITGISESGEAATARVQAAHLDDTAYVIYTSGSTGVPKGVRVTHRGLADLVHSQRELFGVRTGSRVLQFASPGFDASLFEMFLAFGAGATVVVVPPGIYAGRELEAFIAETAVTHVCLTPTVLQITDPSATPSVEVVIMAGEAANSELLQRWSDGRAVFNAYGPTEATIMSTCTTEQSDGQDTVTIGGPVSGFTAVVLDARLRPVPENVVGELYLGGPGLAEGYLGQPGATAARFVPDIATGAGRLYRTGDLVRWSGGELEFLGRVDSQVKIRGHRVELAEVQAQLLRSTGVEQACVVGREDSLAAYVVGDVDPRAVRERLARAIPSFMVPSTVTRVDALPVSMSGKIDASRLPAPTPPSVTPERPSTQLEFAVRAAFAGVLELDADRIGAEDNFFDLGGHSLSVVRVMDALSEQLGRTVPIRWLLQFPTVRSLAAQLDSDSEIDSAAGVFDVMLPLRGDGNREPLFCIHPAIGIAWSYYSLLAETDRPVYGLQLPGIADGETPPDSIDEFADRYAAEIRAVQPRGPYHLLGWSLGGVIAHAVAARLQDVAQLVLVDAHLSAPADAAEFSVEDLGRQLGVAGSTFEEIVSGVRSGGSELTFLTVEHLTRMFHPVTMASRWVAQYSPRVFDGDVVYVAARGSAPPTGWERCIGGHISVREIDAAHEDMLGSAGARALGRVIGTHVREGVAS